MGKDHVGSKKTEEDVVNKENQWLFAKLAKVLGAKNPIEADGEQDWNSILKLAKQHAVLSLLDPLLDEPEECGKIPENVKICIREEARKTVRQNYHLLYLEHRIIRTLQEAGVSVVLLKGASTAEFYPVPELRKSGDVDLFLPNPAQFPKAGERMENLGFVKNPAHSVNHHEVYVTEKHVEVELHTLLAEPFDDKETNRLMEELQKEVAVQAGKKKLMGIEFPVLPDGIHAYYLLLHMLQHFLRAGFGLKLLCDWVVFWRHGVTEKELAQYKKLTARSGLTGFSDMVTSVCVQYLGLEEEAAEPLIVNMVSGEDMWGFMEEILQSLEFGTMEFTIVDSNEQEGRWSYSDKRDVERTLNGIKEALYTCEAVVIMIHSHEIKADQEYEADYFMEEFAHACIDAGACAVVGSGTHQMKGIEFYKDCPIFYCLGNFIFENEFVRDLPADYMEKYGLPESASGAEGIAKRSAKAKKTLYTIPEVYQTVIPYFEIIDGKCVKTELLPVSLGFYKERYKKNLPYVADEIEALAILEYLNRACRPYGVEWCYSGGIMIRSK